MNQLWQQRKTRDYFGNWSPPAIRNLDILNDPGCFRASWYSAPKFSERVIPELGYRQSQLTLPAGGYIYAISVNNTQETFQLQITDLNLQRMFFNAPVESYSLRQRPFPLPDLYPIVAPGVFKVELWNSVPGAGDLTCEVVLHFVEPRANVNR